MNKLILQVLIVTAFLVIVSCDSKGEDEVGIREHARFIIGAEVVNKGLKPFTATIGGIGNTLIRSGSGFEPTILRNRYTTLKNSPDRVYATPAAISHWDVLREGALDNAEVFVYRIENGQVKLVRKDRVQDGGHHASGWLPIKKSRLLSKNVREYRFNWKKWNRPDVKYYFTVRAVDRSGNLSPPAPHFSITSPATLKKGASNNPWIAFKPSKITLDRKPPPAPKNLRGSVGQDGTLLLQWDVPDSSDLAGYYVYRSDYSPEEHTGYYLQLENKPEESSHHIKKDDLVVISKKFYGGSGRRYLTNRVWGDVKSEKLFEQALVRMLPDNEPQVNWELLPHESSTLVEAPGETYLRINVATAKPVAIGVYNHSGTAQDWYDVLHTRPYKIEVWLRKRGTGKVRFRMRGTFDKKPQKIPHIQFIPGEKWKKYTATFTPPVVLQGKIPNAMVLEFSGEATFDIDNFRIFRADTEHLDYTSDEYSEVKHANIMALRTHSLIKTGINTYDIEQLTNPGGIISSTKRQNTLPQLLGIMKKAGVNPWLQIEPHLAPDEWRSLIEFIAAPYNPERDDPLLKPWAYKRYMQGQMQPWTEEFDKIYFEIGNETWNRLFAPWTFTAMTDVATGRRYSAGNVYGLFQEYVITLLRSSPYWNNNLENKFVFILGGHAWSDYGVNAADLSPSTDYMTIAGYNGGWDENEGPPGLGKVSYFNVLNQVNQVAIPRTIHHKESINKLNPRGREKKLRIGTYEAGPGYAMSGLNNAKVSKKQAAEQELVMKSLASGTAALDSFLSRASLGFGIQNFFTLGPGTMWKSHAKWYDGGHAYPAWKLISLFNNHAAGDMLRVDTVSVPGVRLNAYKKRMAVDSAPQVAVYATKNKDRVSVFVISRKIPDFPVSGDDGYTPVSIKLPFRKSEAVTLFRMAGDYRSSNVADNNVKVEQVALSTDRFSDGLNMSSLTGADDRGVPPASTFLYIFDGASGFLE